LTHSDTLNELAEIGKTPEGEIEQFLTDVWGAEVLAEAERLKAKQVAGPTGATLEVPTSEPASHGGRNPASNSHQSPATPDPAISSQ